MRTHFFAAIAAVIIATPLAAQAQDMPSYAQPVAVSRDEQIHGRIVDFDGGYNLRVRDERGFIDNVQLHQGTIINPTGLTLAPGMVVSIDGYNAGPYLAANEIDTPYTFYDGVPYYHGYAWDHWGPSVSLSFFFGDGGWWHGGGGYHWNEGVRVYDVHRNVYVGGDFHGRDYVAPRERGGYYPHGGSYGYRGGDHGGDHGDHGGDHGGHGGHR
ncbi:MAG TPA: hypothetical protein VE591_10145 [Candidatus Acidoferrum sp.]|nr:hypothetical protein [Candidatus Acidoferrum sp.]